jgi:hypothetical protein
MQHAASSTPTNFRCSVVIHHVGGSSSAFRLWEQGRPIEEGMKNGRIHKVIGYTKNRPPNLENYLPVAVVGGTIYGVSPKVMLLVNSSYFVSVLCKPPPQGIQGRRRSNNRLAPQEILLKSLQECSKVFSQSIPNCWDCTKYGHFQDSLRNRILRELTYTPARPGGLGDLVFKTNITCSAWSALGRLIMHEVVRELRIELSFPVKFHVGLNSRSVLCWIRVGVIKEQLKQLDSFWYYVSGSNIDTTPETYAISTKVPSNFKSVS